MLTLKTYPLMSRSRALAAALCRMHCRPEVAWLAMAAVQDVRRPPGPGAGGKTRIEQDPQKQANKLVEDPRGVE